MVDDAVEWRMAERIGHIELNRPDAGNAINLELARAFTAAVAAAAGADVRAIMISAHGERFCVGGDIRAFAERADEMQEVIREIIDALTPAILQLTGLPVPVVSVLQGAVGGGGIGLGLCADVVVASSAMRLRAGYSAIGLTPDLGSSYQLARRIGAARTKVLLMTNRVLSANECLQLGIVDAVFPPEKLRTAADQLTRSLAEGATTAFGRIKQLCDTSDAGDFRSQLQCERKEMLESAGTDEAREGVQAFLEKRPPRFS